MAYARESGNCKREQLPVTVIVPITPFIRPAGILQALEASDPPIMKDEPLIEKEELYRIVEKAGNEALKTEKFQKMEAQDKISNIFEQTNNSSYVSEIRLDLEHIDIDKLTWRDPIASQVISDDSDMIKNLSIGAYQFFMKLAKQMQVDSLPNIIQEECNQFLNDFKEKNLNLLCNKYKHNNTWIESNEKLCEITKEILNTFAKKQSKANATRRKNYKKQEK
ncbi:hypothetical protein RhiirA4_448407 [Rhizophagus irregularis]|uniref:Uncharacterized protein n=1 Tax=Rhizophagus irregularis TaxID=588596 RepID=A0A2I1H9E2_9GLOM|nr:hypothetical protein RhiirA4_448407 [Rhizophagus irregularis]